MNYIYTPPAHIHRRKHFNNRLRRWFCGTLFYAAVLSLLLKAIAWQYDERLQSYSDARYLRELEMPAYRGIITDRNNKLLASSTPVYSLWLDPKVFPVERSAAVAELMTMAAASLQAKLARAHGKRFLYIKRQITPQLAARLRALNIHGLYLDQEYKRFYPPREITAHIVGLTDIDGNGIEGLELEADAYLRATAGLKQVLVDAERRTLQAIKLIHPPNNGRALQLSLDLRVQHAAYRILRDALIQQRAKSGSVVVLNAQSGEIIAAVNQPSFNPNNRDYDAPSRRRNRLLTDTFEPGSTIKPVVMAAAIDGDYLPGDAIIDTTPGYAKIDHRKYVRDIKNYGKLDATAIIAKSSNVGMSKVGQRLPREVLWSYLDNIGFGQTPGTTLPGEAGGKLRYHTQWSPTDQLVLAYGYGVSVSPLQLAVAYTAFANSGWRANPSFIKDNPNLLKTPVFTPQTAAVIRAMLQAAVSDKSTGALAKVKGFTTAGKTGTTRKSVDDKGSENKYTAAFVGFAPITPPNFVCVVVIDEPSAGDYYGGLVAAPVFSQVMSATLRFMGISYDDYADTTLVTAPPESAPRPVAAPTINTLSVAAPNNDTPTVGTASLATRAQ